MGRFKEEKSQERKESLPGGIKWYKIKLELPECPKCSSNLTSLCSILLEHCNKLCPKDWVSTKPFADQPFMEKVSKRGSVSDRLAAVSLLIQQSPIGYLPDLEPLLMLVLKDRTYRTFLSNADNITELFLSELLPPDRSLRSFQENVSLAYRTFPEVNSKHWSTVHTLQLVLWRFEDQLKRLFGEFVAFLLEKGLHSQLLACRKRTCQVVCSLVEGQSRVDGKLLSALVNKLGDPDHSVASLALALSTKLCRKSSELKCCLIDDVEKLVFRRNVTKSAQRYALCLLQAVKLKHNERDLAVKLIKIYFDLFKQLIANEQTSCKKKDSSQGNTERHLSLILTGISRAFPFSGEADEAVADHISSLYRMVHVDHFLLSVRALAFLYQIVTSESKARFYNALYAKILDPQLKHSGRQAIFLQLVYRAVGSLLTDGVTASSMADAGDLPAAKAILKRLLQVACQHGEASFVCSSLLLTNRLICSPMGQGHPMLLLFEREPNEKDQYDPLKRNPSFSNASPEPFWELSLLQNHYHPSVAIFAQQVAKRKRSDYDSDPFEDFAVSRFLDRFVMRKKRPKALVAPGISSSSRERKRRSLFAPDKLPPVKRRKREGVAAVDPLKAESKFMDVFFDRPSRRSRAGHRDGDDAGSISDDEFDNYLDNIEDLENEV